MNIKINNTIRDKYHTGFVRSSEPIEIVIHGTGGGDSASTMIAWMMSGERIKEYMRGVALFHYLVDFTGEVFEIISPNMWVYHSSSGAHDKLTIGIELMNKSASNLNDYKYDQYKALFDLLSQLMEKYKIRSIVGHGYNAKEYSGTDKNCPGNFDWEKLGGYLTDKYYQYEYSPRRYFNIRSES